MEKISPEDFQKKVIVTETVQKIQLISFYQCLKSTTYNNMEVFILNPMPVIKLNIIFILSF